MNIHKLFNRLCTLIIVLFTAAMLHSVNAGAETTTIDITPDGDGVKSGISGENWSYGDITIPGFGVTKGILLERGEFTLTGTNDKCMVSIKSGVTKVTLKNCNITSENNYPGILMDSTYDMTFHIQGKNMVTTTQTGSRSFSSCALFTQNECNYKFTGNGIIGFIATNAIGIYDGNITIDGPEVDVYGEMQGIRTSGRFLMQSGKLYVVTPTSSANSAVTHSYGITADSSVTIAGGYTNIQSGNCSIQSNSFVKITGGENELTVDTRKEGGFAGIESLASVEITGGTTTITTPAAQAISCDVVTVSDNALKTMWYDTSGTGTHPNVTLSSPVGLKAVNKTYNKCRLSWNPVENAAYYEVYRSVYADGPWEYLGKSSTNKMADKTLDAGTTYYYKIRACIDASTASDYSPIVWVKAAPAAPKKVRVSKQGSTLKIKLKKCKKVSGYKIYLSTNAKSGFKCIKNIKKGSAVSYNKSGIKRGRTYYVKIKAYYRTSTKTICSKFSKTVH